MHVPNTVHLFNKSEAQRICLVKKGTMVHHQNAISFAITARVSQQMRDRVSTVVCCIRFKQEVEERDGWRGEGMKGMQRSRGAARCLYPDDDEEARGFRLLQSHAVIYRVVYQD